MTRTIADEDVALARRWASFYRQRGFNPLPMRIDAKRPLVRFAKWWDTLAPEDLFDQFESPSIQVMTERRWRLLVIDLDGPEAREWFYGLGRPIPRTWSTHSGGDGRHLWFRLPNWLSQEMPKSLLWGEWDATLREGQGGWVKRKMVERLCDHSLIVAPPSIHPKTGERYRFTSKQESPERLPMPALCPGWILGLKPLSPPWPVALETPVVTHALRTVKLSSSRRYAAEDVLASIHDKIGLAESWGLRVATRRPNQAGWCQCHAIGREDRNPSASISAESGRYWEPGERTISLFELGVRLGVYLDWRDAVSDLGAIYGARRTA